MSNDLIRTDSDVSRNRGVRTIVALSTPFALVLIGASVGYVVSWWLSIPIWIGVPLGMAGGSYFIPHFWKKSMIDNEATIALVTVDQLATLFPTFGKTFNLTPLVVYGPGRHFCFWWESRSAENVVNLVESSEPFSVLIQTDTGEVTFDGAIRFRPDLLKLEAFINGVASVSSDATDLVEAFILEEISQDNKKLVEILQSAKKLNEKLHVKFQEHKDDKVTGFEGRFGVIVGDATISKITPSEEVRKTLSAITESDLMDQMVAKSFGCESYAELAPKIGTPGGPTMAQVNQVRTQKMAASGNLEGMDLRDHTLNVNLSGLDTITPESATAIGAILATFMNRGNSTPSKKGTRR